MLITRAIKLVAILLCPSVALSAVTVNGSVSSVADSTLASASLTHTVPASTDLLVVFIQGWETGSPLPTVSWSGGGGESLTNIAQSSSWGNGQQAIWYRASPTAATGGTVSVSGGGTMEDGGIIQAINLTGVDATVGTSGIRSSVNTQADSRTTITLSPTTTSTDLIVTQWSQQQSVSLTGQTYGGTSGTQSLQSSLGGNNDATFLTTSQPTGTGQNVTFLGITGSNYPSGISLSIAAASAPPPSSSARPLRFWMLN